MSEPPRPSSQPQPATIPLGNGGEYYLPSDGNREPGVVLAAGFLLEADREEPAIREDLRTYVFPFVPWTADFDSWRNEKGVFDFYADDFVPPERPTSKPRTEAERYQAAMDLCILGLRDWARRWRIGSPHVMTVAIHVLKGWVEDNYLGASGAAARGDTWGRSIDFVAYGWSCWPDGNGELWRKSLAARDWKGGPPSFQATIKDRWEPRLETWQEFVERAQHELEQELEIYRFLCDLHLEEHGFKKVPRPKARHHLSWLVQHRICGLTCEEIADRYAEENPQLESSPSAGAVAKAIRRTAAMIELE